MHAYRADVAFDGERLLPAGALVLVDDGRIIGVERADSSVPDGCAITYFTDATLLPGLIDAHVHLCADSGPRALEQIPELSAARLGDVISQSMQAQLAAGVTTVRDLGDIDYAVVARRGDPDGPTVVASGPPITSFGGHCAQLGGEAAGEDDLREAVRDRAHNGVDVIKIMTSGGLMSPATDVTVCQFSLAELRAVVDEAHRLGLPVTAHAHALAAVEMCAEAGVDGIEHCTCMTRSGLLTPPPLVARLAAAGIIVCPTLGRTSAVPPPQIAAAMERTGLSWTARLAQVGDLYRGGVTLISGGDSGINPAKPHGVLPAALEDLVICGVPAEQALASATGAAARGIGLGHRKGLLRAGYDADLLVVGGNPLADISAIRNARLVVLRGAPID